MIQTAEIAWRGRVPVSARFDDPYFSLDDGAAEARHVFLAGNDLPARFHDGFHIAELGFGTGLNFLVALQSFREARLGGRLRYTGFEAYPLDATQLTRALAAHQDLPITCLLARAASRLPDRISGPDFDLALVTGDARATLRDWDGVAAAWFLDGFAPARNPQMWEAGLMDQVARHTAPGGTFATYTAAGHVRRALDRSGFVVERVAGFGRKRHMTRGRLR